MNELSGKPYYVSDIQDYFECILKKHETNANNPSIKIYVNKLEKRITIKLKRGYYPDLLTPETMKLLRSTKSKITKDKNSENVPHLEINDVVLSTTIIDMIQESCIHIFLINRLVNHNFGLRLFV